MMVPTFKRFFLSCLVKYAAGAGCSNQEVITTESWVPSDASITRLTSLHP
jgi:hypothetical protein